MKIKVVFLILLQGFALGSARADDERCQVPPYGTSMEAYRALVVETRQSGEAGSPDAQKIPREVAEALTKVCKIKYDAADRTEFYRAGFTPQDIDRSSIVMLAAEYLGVLKYVAFQNVAHGQKAVEPRVPTRDEYQQMGVRDLVADGAKLAAADAKVSLTGSYILQDHRDVLYESVQAVIKTKSASVAASAQPNVPLLTDGASPRVRRRLLACQTDPSASQVGCTVTIRGQATMCRSPDASEAAREVPCVKVEDGK